MRTRQTYLESTTPEQRLDNARKLEALLQRESARLGFFIPGGAGIEEIVRLLLRGVEGSGFTSISFQRVAEDVWGAEATVNVRIKAEPMARYGVSAQATVSWSSTERSVALAVYTVALYQEAIQLAAFVQALFER